MFNALSYALVVLFCSLYLFTLHNEYLLCIHFSNGFKCIQLCENVLVLLLLSVIKPLLLRLITIILEFDRFQTQSNEYCDQKSILFILYSVCTGDFSIHTRDFLALTYVENGFNFVWNEMITWTINATCNPCTTTALVFN